MTLQPAPYARQAGQDWLLACADTPAEIQSLWDGDELGPFPAGEHWMIAETSLARTMDALRRIDQPRRGPVLADVTTGITWWLLPSALGKELNDVSTITVHPRGWVLRCPPVLDPVRGRVWLERPDGTGQFTDPVLLGAALGPGGAPRLPAEASL